MQAEWTPAGGKLASFIVLLMYCCGVGCVMTWYWTILGLFGEGRVKGMTVIWTLPGFKLDGEITTSASIWDIRNYWLIRHTREIYGEIYIRQLGTMIRDLLLDKSPLLCWIEWDDLIPSFIQLHIISFYQANLDFSLHSLKEVLQF